MTSRNHCKQNGKMFAVVSMLSSRKNKRRGGHSILYHPAPAINENNRTFVLHALSSATCNEHSTETQRRTSKIFVYHSTPVH